MNTVTDYHDQLNVFELEQVKVWLHDRLHGQYGFCPPPNPRDEERRYVLASDLHGSARMSDQFKLHLRSAVCDAIASTAREYPQGQWTDPEALDSLLLLAVDVSEGLVRSGLKDTIARSLWELVGKLPFLADDVPLKRFAAMALLDSRLPPPQPETFWKDLWTQAAADGWTGFAGVVFEGLWRHVGLEAAAQWFATATPWDEEVMSCVLDDKLSGIIADSNLTRITEVLEQYLMLPLKDVEKRLMVRQAALKHGVKLWKELHVASGHWPILRRIMKDEHGIEHAHMELPEDSELVLCSPEAAAVIKNLLIRFEHEKIHFPKAKDRTLWAAVGERFWIEFIEQVPRSYAEPFELAHSKAAQKSKRHADTGVINLNLPTVGEARRVVVEGLRWPSADPEHNARLVMAMSHAFELTDSVS